MVRCRLAVLCLLLVFFMPAGATNIEVHPDRSSVAIDESLQLTFSADASVDADPDFSPLKQDFEILRQNHSTSVLFAKGEYSRTTYWVLDLLAKRAGKISIPSIRFGSDATRPIEITVTDVPSDKPSAKDEELFIEVDTAPKDPYVQQQVIVKIKLFRRVEISDASLSDPATTGADAVIEQIGRDKNYNEERHGLRYDVIERDFAVFPQRSGRITIEPLVFEAQVIEGGSSLFDPFGSRITTRRLRSAPIELNARPVPAQFAGKVWLPSGLVQLHEVWSEDSQTFRVGEPVTRTLALLANGLTSSQLPELAPPLPAGLKQYPDAPVLSDQRNQDGMVGLRQEKLAIIPSEPGRYRLPPIEIPWWNTDSNTMETAQIPARDIEVLPAVSAQGALPGTQLPAPAAQPATAAPDASVAAPPPAIQSSERWLWLCVALAAGWVLTALAWWHATRTTRPPRSVGPREEPLAVARVRQACRGRDANACKDALLIWAATHWQGSAVTSLAALGRRTSGPFAAELDALSRALYGTAAGAHDSSSPEADRRNPTAHGTAEPWSGTTLLAAFNTFLESEQHAPRHRPSQLEPLFRG